MSRRPWALLSLGAACAALATWQIAAPKTQGRTIESAKSEDRPSSPTLAIKSTQHPTMNGLSKSAAESNANTRDVTTFLAAMRAQLERASDNAEEQEEPQRPSGSSMHSDLRQIWASETADQDWTADVSVRIATAFEDHDLRGEIVDVSCRQTQCFVKVLVSDPHEARQLALESGLDDHRESHRLTPREGGGFEVEAFLAR